MPSLSLLQMPATRASDLPDAELAARTAGGDREAAHALVARHEQAVRAFLRRVCFDQAQVEDLAQETFLRLLRHADRYDPAYPMRTWLFTIARRLSITSGERRQFLTKPETLARIGSRPETPESRVDRQDRLDHTNRLLDRALTGLTEPQRTAIVLFYQQNLPLEEISKVMEMPAGTVKSHLHRARAALAESLSPHAEEFLP